MKIEEQVLSREQMAHLVELGVDTSDASMVWIENTNMCDWRISTMNPISRLMCKKGMAIPTYTIGDLIGKLPKEIAFTFSCASYKYEKIGFSPEVRYQLLHTHDSDLKEDLYNAICWVAKYHKELIK